MLSSVFLYYFRPTPVSALAALQCTILYNMIHTLLYYLCHADCRDDTDEWCELAISILYLSGLNLGTYFSRQYCVVSLNFLLVFEPFKTLLGVHPPDMRLLAIFGCWRKNIINVDLVDDMKICSSQQFFLIVSIIGIIGVQFSYG